MEEGEEEQQTAASATLGRRGAAPSEFSPESLSTLDEYAANPRFIQLQEELRGVLFAGASSYDVSRHASPEAQADDQPTASYTPDLLSRVRIPKARLVQYMQNWVMECAPYLDKFDCEKHFGVRVPVVSETSPALMYAVLAFSARQMERKNGWTKNHDSLELYQESIRLLAPGMQARDANMLVTACILAVLELMSGSARTWRRHIEGCATLFDLFKVNGLSGGMLQGVFWCYARMEVCGAIISNGTQSTVLPLRKWLPDDADEDAAADLFYQSGGQNPDMHANWSVYLCANACDLLCRRTRFLELREHHLFEQRPFVDQWRRLWRDLQFWYETRPRCMLPTQDTDPEGAFPTIFFAHYPAISCHQVYHATCIIALEMRPKSEPVPPSPRGSLIWHARRVCGISLTNPHKASLINAIQPLYLAGRLLTHTSEHVQVARLFKIIEQSTGWGALWRLRDLEAVWGYRPGEIAGSI